VSTERPIPVPDDTSAAFWAAAAEHKLVVAQCSRCGALTLPPDVVCTACGCTEPAMTFTRIDGGAVVRSWTVVRQALLPGFADDLPFVLVDAELTDAPGLRLIGRLLDGPDAELSVGAQLVCAFEDVAPGISVPAFELAR
jgi:uncharacterized OB-fold protein